VRKRELNTIESSDLKQYRYIFPNCASSVEEGGQNGDIILRKILNEIEIF
jgi:hypothetical protein